MVKHIEPLIPTDPIRAMASRINELVDAGVLKCDKISVTDHSGYATMALINHFIAVANEDTELAKRRIFS